MLPPRYREGVAGAIRGSVLYPFMAIQRGSLDEEGRYLDASAIRAERDSLAAFLVGQAGLAAENRRLRALLGMRDRLPNSFVAAEVMPFEGAAPPGTFLLPVGAEDAVRTGSAIVTAQGLVGMVKEVRRGSSVGFDWTNPNFRASAVSEDGETYGILEPRTGPGGERMLALTPTALHTVPDSGSTIVTSGSGATYPRGIPIGQVVGTESQASTWQRTYLIRPFVSPGEVTHVLVLGEPRAGATDRDLAAAWGIRLREGPAPDSVVLPVAPPAPAPARPAATTPARPAPSRPT
ncbi:MAG TPA: rod shape-determining protein MreC, partial [Longimicrobiaceae bacterium]|nr:rod shape-determining protein MreC [Longimicrobiaceae bacterium]